MATPPKKPEPESKPDDAYPVAPANQAPSDPAAEDEGGKHAAAEAVDPVEQASATPAGVHTPVEDQVIGG